MFAVECINRSHLILKGPDGLDLLHRISTNDLSKLGLGETVTTILTNEKGKIIDIVAVHRVENDRLLLCGHSTDGQVITEWIQKFIIMENAEIAPFSDQMHRWVVWSDTPELAGEFEENLTSTVVSFREDWNSITALHLVVLDSKREELLKRFAAFSIPVKTAEEYEVFRIGQGIPSWPQELHVRANPLEAGLVRWVSFTKGCYIGQEVIARLDTYKKVQRTLVRLSWNAPPGEVPLPIVNEREEVGTLTSAALDPGRGHWIGLGFVRSEMADGKVGLSLKGREGMLPLSLLR